jgi:8-oxo-dGTP pyrophosphatase MutT (NUDIX family)
MQERQTSRIILINELSEILLLKYVDKAPVDPSRPTLLTYWVPPGGGLEHGESFEEVAMRELEEEIGVCPDIGPWVWTRKRNLEISGHMKMVTERYFVTRVGGGRVTPVNSTKDNFVSHKWWTLAEITEALEVILPPSFAMLVAPILNGKYPQYPIDIDAV